MNRPQLATRTDGATPIDWRTEGLRAELAPLLPGLSVDVAASVGSTNSVLLDRIRTLSTGAADDRGARIAGNVESRAAGSHAVPTALPSTLLIAERQTAGRGRHGRSWRSEPGRSLTFSLALPLELRDWSGLSLAVGVALADALDPASPGNAAPAPLGRPEGPARHPPRIGLKWPNDLWLVGGADPHDAATGRKLGGILVETVVAPGGQRIAVVGVGLNVAPLDPGADVSTGSAALRELDARLDAPAALRRVAKPLAEALRRFERLGFEGFVEGFARRDLLLDRALSTSSPAAANGLGRGVAANGALRVELADGAIVEVASGDVSVRPTLSGTARRGAPARC